MTYILNGGVSGRLYGGHPVRNTVIGVSVLLVLLVGGGLAYTYFYGPESTPKSVAPPPAKPVVRERQPPKPSPNTAASASVQSLTSPVPAGENASLSVRTVATSKCNVQVAYAGVKSADSGLAPKVADEYGIVTWTWTVDAGAPAGSWPVNVTCAYMDKTAEVVGALEVTR